MGAFNRLSIINGVLAQYGQGPVSTPEDNETSRLIDRQLDRLLPLYQKTTVDWSFLRTTVTLSSPADDLSPKWKYTFIAPDDYLRVKKVFNQPFGAFEWRGKYLLTNSPTITFDYIRFSDEYSYFPAHFLDGFIYFCAYRLALGVTRSIDTSTALTKFYEEIILPDLISTESRLESGQRAKLNRGSRIAPTEINT